MRMAPLLNRHYDKTQSAAVNRHLAILAGMRAPSESAASDPPPIQTRFWTSETAVFHPPSADSGPIQDGMFDDGRDIAMQRFLFDVACLIGAFFAISQNRKKLIRRHEQLHSGSRDDVGEFSCRRCMYNYDGSCG